MTPKNLKAHRISDTKYRKKLALTHVRFTFSIKKTIRSEFVDCLSKDARYSSTAEFLNNSIKRYIQSQIKRSQK